MFMLGGQDDEDRNNPNPTPTATPTPLPKPEDSVAHQEVISSWAILILISLLFAILLTSYYLQRKKIRFIHETVVSIFLGIAVGLAIRLADSKAIQEMIAFDHHYFFNLLLPPIILNSGYDLKRKNFFRNFGTILTFAFAGTLISTIVIGILLRLVVMTGMNQMQLSFLDCMVFGAILSSTDPVTILAIFHQMGVDPKLFAMIFGESILNDSVAIVLFTTLSQFHGKEITAFSIVHGVGSFLFVFFGSLMIGVIIALICSLMLKHSKLYHYPSLESCIISLMAYSSYLLSNAIQLSGIVSLLFCGITLKHYAYDNMSIRSKRTTKYMFRVLSQLSENFVFIYLGVTLFTKDGAVYAPGFIFFTLIIIMIARYCSTIPLAQVVNYINRKVHPDRTEEVIPRNYQLMLWWAGLRGAVAFALSFDVPGPSALAVRTTTLVVCVVSVVVLGGTTNYALELLNIRVGVGRKHIEDDDDNAMDYEGGGGGGRASADEDTDSSEEEIDEHDFPSSPLVTHHLRTRGNFNNSNNKRSQSASGVGGLRSFMPPESDEESAYDLDNVHPTDFHRTHRRHNSTGGAGGGISGRGTPTSVGGRNDDEWDVLPPRSDSDMTHWFISFDSQWLKPLFTKHRYDRWMGRRSSRASESSPTRVQLLPNGVSPVGASSALSSSSSSTWRHNNSSNNNSNSNNNNNFINYNEGTKSGPRGRSPRRPTGQDDDEDVILGLGATNLHPNSSVASLASSNGGGGDGGTNYGRKAATPVAAGGASPLIMGGGRLTSSSNAGGSKVIGESASSLLGKRPKSSGISTPTGFVQMASSALSAFTGGGGSSSTVNDAGQEETFMGFDGRNWTRDASGRDRDGQTSRKAGGNVELSGLPHQHNP